MLPGGIDSHVHLAQPFGDGVVMADDFVSGTRAAACGGSTSVLSYCLQAKGQAKGLRHLLASIKCVGASAGGPTAG